MDRAASNPRVVAQLAVLLAAAVCACTVAGTFLTAEAERLASIWPSNALVLGALLLRPHRDWGAALAGGALGNLVGNQILGDGAVQASWLAAANLAEIAIAATAMRMLHGEDRAALSRRWLFHLGTCATLACAASATIASLALEGMGGGFADHWLTYFPSHLIGAITLVPVIIALAGELPGSRALRGVGQLPLIVALTAAISCIIFIQLPTSSLFLIFPVLTFAAFRAGVPGAATSLFVFNVLATAFTLHDLGPVTMVGGGGRAQMLFLQGLILTATLTTLPVGLALADRKAAFVRQAVLADEALAASSAKSRFLANMSHEIRTPLTGVLGFTELLQTAKLDAEQAHQAAMIHSSAEALLSLLNDILDLSKIEAGQMRCLAEPVNLVARLNDCAALVAPVAEAKGLKVAFEPSPGLPEWMEGDNLRLRQIMLNLLGNAVKFSEHGRIRIGAARQGNGVRITVTDEGIGISPDRQAQIFDEFVQAEDTTARDHGGSGLGLSISRRLAHILGGDLSLWSAPGEGTTLYLDLPVKEVAPPPTPLAPAARQTGYGRSARILLAEDFELNREVVGMMLDRLGHTHDAAFDGQDALARIDQSLFTGEHYDIILMDARMPRIDGLEATRRLRASERYARTPIIGLTANVFVEDVAACLAAGMDTVLHKPVRIEELRVAIESMLVSSENAVLDLDCETLGEVETPKTTETVLPPPIKGMAFRYAEQRATMLARINALVGSGNFPPAILDEIVDLAHKLAGSAGMFGDPATGDLAYALEECVRGFAAGGEEAIRHAAAALQQAA